MAKVPKVTFKNGSHKEIRKRNSSYHTKTQVVLDINNDLDLAQQMTDRGMKRLAHWLNHDKPAKGFKKDPIASLWFGTDQVSATQIKKIRNRLRGVRERLKKKKMRVTCKKQPKNNTKLRGRNVQPFANSFSLFPFHFDKRYKMTHRAALIVHELFHKRWFDATEGFLFFGNPIYGKKKIEKLARDKPKKARQNPQNYYFFIQHVWAAEITNVGDKWSKIYKKLI